MVARFFKIAPGQDWPRALDDPRWWFIHRFCQYTALAFTVVAAALILWRLGGPKLRTGHGLMGWALLCVAALQLFGGLMRGEKGGPTAPAPDGSLRGDHYDMTPRRILFERAHKSLGYVALALGLACVVAGLWIANAPRWMWIVIAGWAALWGTLFAIFQRRGMAVDTYQAIWGPDPALPGAGRPPIGWGVRRRDAKVE
jgi:hypothetical protein